MNQMRQEELLELFLLFSGTDLSHAAKAKEKLVMRYASYKDMLSDDGSFFSEKNGFGTAAEALFKFIRESAKLIYLSEKSGGNEMTYQSNFHRTVSRFIDDHDPTRMERIHALIAGYNYDKEDETFSVMLLDEHNHFLDHLEIARGSRGAVYVDLNAFFRKILTSYPTGTGALILIHSHPNGDLTPSVNDYDLTDQIKQRCSATGISFINHFIVGKGSYRMLYPQSGLHGLPLSNLHRMLPDGEDAYEKDDGMGDGAQGHIVAQYYETDNFAGGFSPEEIFEDDDIP